MRLSLKKSSPTHQLWSMNPTQGRKSKRKQEGWYWQVHFEWSKLQNLPRLRYFLSWLEFPFRLCPGCGCGSSLYIVLKTTTKASFSLFHTLSPFLVLKLISFLSRPLPSSITAVCSILSDGWQVSGTNGLGLLSFNFLLFLVPIFKSIFFFFIPFMAFSCGGSPLWWCWKETLTWPQKTQPYYSHGHKIPLFCQEKGETGAP